MTPIAPIPGRAAVPSHRNSPATRTILPTFVRDRMANVRAAFHLHHLALVHRSMLLFCREFNLFEEERAARALMIEHLRQASGKWRLVLGLPPKPPPSQFNAGSR